MCGRTGITMSVAAVLVVSMSGCSNAYAQTAFHACTTCQEQQHVPESTSVPAEQTIEEKSSIASNSKEIIIYMLLSAMSPAYTAAMRDISSFKKDHRSWSIKIIVSGSMEELKQFSTTTILNWPNNLEYTWDIGNSYREEDHVAAPLTYIFRYEGQQQRKEGYVAVSDYISDLERGGLGTSF